jgi:hypothetical protein
LWHVSFHCLLLCQCHPIKMSVCGTCLQVVSIFPVFKIFIRTFGTVPKEWRSLRSWSYGSWIYNYLCNQCLSPLTLWDRIPLRRDVLDTTICDRVCQWLATGRWFFPGSPVFSTNKSDRHDITEILLKVKWR